MSGGLIKPELRIAPRSILGNGNDCDRGLAFL